MEVIETYNIDDNLLELQKYISYDEVIEYNIFFSTFNSHHYCNYCIPIYSYCVCNDGDWLSGIWNGKILKYNEESYEDIYNLYQYLKLNFDHLIKLDRMELKKWLYDNLYNYLKIFYIKKYAEFKRAINDCYENGIFGNSFFENFKDLYINKYKQIDKIKIKNKNDITSIFLKKDKVIDFQRNYYENNSLFVISYELVIYIKSLINYLNKNKDFFIINNYEDSDKIIMKCKDILLKYYEYDFMVYPLLEKNKFYDIYDKINKIELLWTKLIYI